MKATVALLFLVTAIHASAIEPSDLSIWQSVDDQTYGDPELNVEAVWYENGDLDPNLLIQVYQAIGADRARGICIRMTGGPCGPGGTRYGGFGGAGVHWIPCTAAMISPKFHPGYIQTPAGWWRNPDYFVKPGAQWCA